MNFKEKWKLYQGYIIIAILSLISVFFLPMLGTEVGLSFAFPNTVAGWIVYVVTKLCIVLINILLFDQFIKQAKINIKDNENYKKAEEIFGTVKLEDEELLTPKQFLSRLYLKKGTTLGVTTALSVFGLTSAILTFDWVSMLTYLLTIISGILFGLMTMANVEEYWTNDYYKLALRAQHNKEEEEKNVIKIKDENGGNSERPPSTDIQECS